MDFDERHRATISVRRQTSMHCVLPDPPSPTATSFIITFFPLTSFVIVSTSQSSLDNGDDLVETLTLNKRHEDEEDEEVEV